MYIFQKFEWGILEYMTHQSLQAEGEHDYYDNFWDEDEVDEGEEVPFKKPVKRINFSQYGNSSEGNKVEINEEELPVDIYCNLIDTLNEKCFQSSLLVMWRFKGSIPQIHAGGIWALPL